MSAAFAFCSASMVARSRSLASSELVRWSAVAMSQALMSVIKGNGRFAFTGRQGHGGRVGCSVRIVPRRAIDPGGALAAGTHDMAVHGERALVHDHHHFLDVELAAPVELLALLRREKQATELRPWAGRRLCQRCGRVQGRA